MPNEPDAGDQNSRFESPVAPILSLASAMGDIPSHVLLIGAGVFRVAEFNPHGLGASFRRQCSPWLRPQHIP